MGNPPPVCRICGGLLPKAVGKGRPRKVCGGECRKEDQRRQHREYYQRDKAVISPKPAPVAIPRPQSSEQSRKGASVAARKASKRRHRTDPSTCEIDYSDAEASFLRAMDEYRRKYARPFPAWSEALEVLISLGYRLVAAPEPIRPRPNPQRGNSYGTS